MGTYIMIIVMATSGFSKSGSTDVVAEFSSSQSCLAAYNYLLKDAQDRGNYILTGGCFKK